MAKKGQPKPKTNTPIGARLNDYTRKCDTYDPVFSKEIKRLAPDWFVHSSEKKKLQLLAMAKNGEPKPNQKTKLGQAFANYTRKNSESEDQDFINQIKKIRLDWFVTRTERSDKKKRILLRMGKDGRPRPTPKNPIGQALRNYMVTDPTFKKTIKKLAPHWFVTRTQKADQKKRLLIRSAKNGEPRPNQKKEPLGRALSNYTVKSSSCYDPTFTRDINKLAPHWFKKTSKKI
jgi:hypothetical protein